jgi:hypothetical protein
MMKIDHAGLQDLLDLYRSALDGGIPVDPTLVDHFVGNRTALLAGFRRLAAGQAILLSCLAAENKAEAAALVELQRIVDEFKEWAEGTAR